MPGTSADSMPATGTQSFSPCGAGGSTISSGVSLWLRKKSAVANLGMVPTPAMAWTLPSLVRTRIGDSPPSPKWENSVTEAASMVAIPASTALPPATNMRMPASVAYSVPAATAPRVPRDARRIGAPPPRCCAQPETASIAKRIADLNLRILP